MDSKNESFTNNLYLQRVIKQGRVGTGKSTLINKVVQTVRNELAPYAVAISTAPTGAAEISINGT